MILSFLPLAVAYHHLYRCVLSLSFTCSPQCCSAPAQLGAMLFQVL